MTLNRNVAMASAAVGVGVMAGGMGGCASNPGGDLAALSRPDCPGQIVCPITGELVCIDRCPAGAGQSANEREVSLAVAQPPACCAGKK